MARLAGRKFLLLIPVLLIVSIATFLLLNLLPGDPAINILGLGATPAAVHQLRQQLHLDDPIYLRYTHWLWQTLHGQLGESYLNKEPVSTAVRQHFPVTLELMVISQVIAIIVSVPLGIWSAYRPNSWADRAATGFSFAMLAAPPYMLGVLMVFVFAVHWHVFPATGYVGLTQNPFENIRDLFLPSLTLALGSLAVYVRLLRAEMIATLQEDYITMARAKGMPTGFILLRHALRPSTFSLVTVAGLNVGTLIGGAFIIEYIFAIPGIGLLTVNSIYSRDYLVVQACVLIVAVGFVLVNFFMDLMYPLLDPRTRHARSSA
ncbi:MAG TPA: ABC transporter permease [Acidimicrobiales bacterium]|nr:ABC transporter permease [Acidimicrobiales bacterium]